MNLPASIPAFTSIHSWADRLAAYRDTEWLEPVLYSIRDEAGRSDNLDWYWAAQGAIDTAPDGADLSDLDHLIAEEARAEREAEMAYAYETRTGRDWDQRGCAPLIRRMAA